MRDHGHGIREDLLPHIFDGYADTPTSSGDSRKGMGIGLSICKTIILAHDGKYLGGEPAGRRHVYFYTSTRR